MKFSTGSSSSSVASDSMSRKSTLCIYTEPDTLQLPVYERMDSSPEAMELKRELETVKSALQQQSESVLKQRHQLVEARQALATREKRAVQERRLRKDQLALVLRSLVLLESRLTREQKQLNASLEQKDKIIRSQQEEIGKLKTRKSYCHNCQQLLGFTSEQTNIETDPEFQSLESTDSRLLNGFARSYSYRERNTTTHFQRNTRLSKSFQLPKKDGAYVNSSSSEEGQNATLNSKGTYIKNKQAFIRRDVFRRSRKYSGRKCKNERDVKIFDVQNNSSSADEETKKLYNTNNISGGNNATNQIAQDIRKASKKIDELIGEAMSKEANQDGNDDTKRYSAQMDRLHGIKRQASDEIKFNRQMFLNNVLSDENNETPWYCNASDPEQDSESFDKIDVSTSDLTCSDSVNKNLNRDEIKLKLSSRLVSADIKKIDKVASLGGDGYNNTSDTKNNKMNSPKGLIESRDTWYSSTSDNDENCSPTEIYKNNPVLECVNQILLQNSLDDSSNDNSKLSNTPSPKTTTKRVQFSTLNSISYEDKVHGAPNNIMTINNKKPNKIVKFSMETSSEHSYEVPNTAQGYNYEVQSIYSNEYEPIIPKPEFVSNSAFNNKNKISDARGSVVKNIAANIESRNKTMENRNVAEKLVSEFHDLKIFNKRKVPRTPPALPPKPKNLSTKWKSESTLKKSTDQDSETVAAKQRVADVVTRKVGQVAIVNNFEPDYCSISEINVPVVSNGKRDLLLTQPTIEIHKEHYQARSVNQNSIAKVVSLPRIQNKISDKDIPRLPQVTEIIIPDEDDKSTENQNVVFQQNSASFLNNFNIPTIHSKLDSRSSIQMGNTVSSILSEINKAGKNTKSEINLTDLDNRFNKTTDINLLHTAESHKAEYFSEANKFDLSENFEEFKIDDDLGNIGAEEYRISSGSSDGSVSEAVTEQTTDDNKYFKTTIGNATTNPFLNGSDDISINTKNLKLTNKPDLLSNIENFETESIKNSDIESTNSSASNSGSYNTVKCEPRIILNKKSDLSIPEGSFDFFLETSGLSAKSIIRPGKPYLGVRPPNANHKNVLKPKDIKMRNSMTTNKINEKPMTTAIKYFEPYL